MRSGNSIFTGCSLARQQWRRTSAMRRTRIHKCSRSLFQHARIQLFLHELYAPACYPMLEKPDQACVRQPIGKAAYVQIQHPVHSPLIESTEQGVQHFVLVASLPESISLRLGGTAWLPPDLWVMRLAFGS